MEYWEKMSFPGRPKTKEVKQAEALVNAMSVTVQPPPTPQPRKVSAHIKRETTTQRYRYINKKPNYKIPLNYVVLLEMEEMVCNYYRVEAKTLSEKSQEEQYCGPRGVIIFLALLYDIAGPSHLGSHFKRDTATVYSSYTRVLDKYDVDKSFRITLETLKDMTSMILTADIYQFSNFDLLRKRSDDK